MVEQLGRIGKTHIMQGQALRGPGFPFTAEQVQLADEVGAFANEHFAPTAERWDQENRFPTENFKALHENGWFRIPIAEEFGGMSKGIQHDPLAWTLIIQALSRACPNTGQTFQIWGHCIAMIEELGTRDQVSRCDALALAGDIWGSCGSDPGSYSQSRQRPPAEKGTVATPVKGGVVLSGRKLFISNSGAADQFFVFAELLGQDGGSQGLIHPVLSRNTEGLTVDMAWDAMGMRGTASDNVVFDNVFVPERDVIALETPNAYYRSILAGSFLTGRAAVYLGTAEAALNFTLDYIRERVKAEKDPVMQYRIGELETVHQAAVSMLYRSAWLWQEVIAWSVPAPQAASFTTLTHSFVGQAALEITSGALELCGGRGMLRSAPLERLHRDVRAYTVSPPTRNTSLINLGAQLLEPREERASLVREGI